MIRSSIGEGVAVEFDEHQKGWIILPVNDQHYLNDLAVSLKMDFETRLIVSTTYHANAVIRPAALMPKKDRDRYEEFLRSNPLQIQPGNLYLDHSIIRSRNRAAIESTIEHEGEHLRYMRAILEGKELEVLVVVDHPHEPYPTDRHRHFNEIEAHLAELRALLRQRSPDERLVDGLIDSINSLIKRDIELIDLLISAHQRDWLRAFTVRQEKSLICMFFEERHGSQPFTVEMAIHENMVKDLSITENPGVRIFAFLLERKRRLERFIQVAKHIKTSGQDFPDLLTIFSRF